MNPFSINLHRGEYYTRGSRTRRVSGPSPRAWGIPYIKPVSCVSLRSIPTCVGNTKTGAFPGFPGSVHPHVRGEYLSTHSFLYSFHGPSPRAWGIRKGKPPEVGACRSIPTCVGNTKTECCSPPTLARSIPTCVGNTVLGLYPALVAAVHPHVRGEYVDCPFIPSFTRGPSPRAWGILVDEFRRRALERSIPTCVGNTSGSHRGCRADPVHPHVRGEYRLRISKIASADGPSPRAWGIRSLDRCRSEYCRSIPTCVGNTYYESLVSFRDAVHPHVRGEYPL